jgi:hypothetical protein
MVICIYTPGLRRGLPTCRPSGAVNVFILFTPGLRRGLPACRPSGAIFFLLLRAFARLYKGDLLYPFSCADNFGCVRAATDICGARCVADAD